MYVKSVNDTVENYTHLLSHAGSENLDLPNRDCDTGRETRAGEYALTDKTYAHLIDQLASKTSGPLSPGLRENLFQFYSDLNAPNATRKGCQSVAPIAGSVATIEAAGRYDARGTPPRPESVNCS
jgi:hypothetical protein